MNASTPASAASRSVAERRPSNASTPARSSSGAAVIASATATASSTVRQPQRPPSWPTSTSTPIARGAPAAASSRCMISTPATESARQ